MNHFSFIGQLPGSRAVRMRSLVVKSYFNNFNLGSESFGPEVRVLEDWFVEFESKNTFVCPKNKNVFQLQVIRASRKIGSFEWTQMNGKISSACRADLTAVLRQLGVVVTTTDNVFRISSKGWRQIGNCVVINSKFSCDLASAILLNSFELPFDLQMSVPRGMIDRSSFDITINFLQMIGWVCSRTVTEFSIKKGCGIRKRSFPEEPDMALALVLGAFATVAGSCSISNFPNESIQPESFFPYVLGEAGAEFNFDRQRLIVKKAQQLFPFECDLSGCEMIFPEILALSALIESGDTFIKGITWEDELNQKEAGYVLDYLRNVGCKVLTLDDGVRVKGIATPPSKLPAWDAQESERLLMAVSLLKVAGWQIEVLNYKKVTEELDPAWKWIGWE